MFLFSLPPTFAFVRFVSIIAVFLQLSRCNEPKVKAYCISDKVVLEDKLLPYSPPHGFTTPLLCVCCSARPLTHTFIYTGMRLKRTLSLNRVPSLLLINCQRNITLVVIKARGCTAPNTKSLL